jgi:hypothetical protein
MIREFIHVFTDNSWIARGAYLAITPPIPPCIAGHCIVPLTDHLMKQEAPITVWAQEIDQEIITKD